MVRSSSNRFSLPYPLFLPPCSHPLDTIVPLTVDPRPPKTRKRAPFGTARAARAARGARGSSGKVGGAPTPLGAPPRPAASCPTFAPRHGVYRCITDPRSGSVSSIGISPRSEGSDVPPPRGSPRGGGTPDPGGEGRIGCETVRRTRDPGSRDLARSDRWTPCLRVSKTVSHLLPTQAVPLQFFTHVSDRAYSTQFQAAHPAKLQHTVTGGGDRR